MPNLTEKTETTSLGSSDIIYAVINPGSTPEDRKVTIANLQSSLTGKQNVDSTLTALAGFNSNGILTQTAADTFTARTITGTSGHVTVSNGSGVSGNPTIDIDSALLTDVRQFVIDGGGSAITTGVKGDLYFPFACTVTSVILLADQVGSLVLDLWKDTYSNYPPTVADSMTASAKPTLSSAIKSQDSTLTGWSPSITAGTTIRINVDSATTVTRATVVLILSK